MSGSYSRNKGRRGEQEIVNLLKKHGVPAKRISMMETGGIDKGDIKVAEIWTAEVKIGNQVPKFIYEARKTEDTQFLFCKRDRGKWLVVLDLEFFLNNFI